MYCFELEFEFKIQMREKLPQVARISKNRLPKRPVLSWIREPRVAGGQEMAFGRSLQRHLSHFDLPEVFTEWAYLAQDRAGWHKYVAVGGELSQLKLKKVAQFIKEQRLLLVICLMETWRVTPSN